ncbi:MAG: hypothetical protein F6K14_19375 [Symploca sp. SIO2C1]|nr:hypothetical protein [Symploca sp. SIO2C1]
MVIFLIVSSSLIARSYHFTRLALCESLAPQNLRRFWDLRSHGRVSDRMAELAIAFLGNPS